MTHPTSGPNHPQPPNGWQHPYPPAGHVPPAAAAQPSRGETLVRKLIAVLVAIVTVPTAAVAGAGVAQMAAFQGMGSAPTVFFFLLVFVSLLVLGFAGASVIVKGGRA